MRLPGWPPLTRERLGDPPTVEWLSIAPTGRVEVWTSDNLLGYAPAHDVWVQWQLIYDVYLLICPAGYGHIRDVRSVHSPHGTVMSPRRRADDDRTWPLNRVATGMAESLDVPLAGEPLYGTVAWLGELTKPDRLHVSLDNRRIERLGALAESLRAL
ncbi:hypothetical protein [Amycolatopsis arida]|uniref:hypothetical protein n=1 Tax=Amycolatopsis arida TaxID=587909 RepID=UPI00141709E9|nr:hypothetical protein [Amycolatopsis arida]